MTLIVVVTKRVLRWVFSHWRARRGLVALVLGIYGTENARTLVLRVGRACAGTLWLPLVLKFSINDFLPFCRKI